MVGGNLSDRQTPDGATDCLLLVKREWPKIKIYANSWVANSLGGERWRDHRQRGLHSWYVDG